MDESNVESDDSDHMKNNNKRKKVTVMLSSTAIPDSLEISKITSNPQNISLQELYSSRDVCEEREDDGASADTGTDYNSGLSSEDYNSSDSSYSASGKRQKKKSTFICPACPLHFTSRVKFDEHRYTHDSLYCHSCQYCEKRFTSSIHLNSHRLKEHPETLFKCTKCERLFFKEEACEKHILIHSEEGGVRYNCDECNMTFHMAVHLYRHMESVHHVAVHTKSRSSAAAAARRHSNLHGIQSSTHPADVPHGKSRRNRLHLNIGILSNDKPSKGTVKLPEVTDTMIPDPSVKGRFRTILPKPSVQSKVSSAPVSSTRSGSSTNRQSSAVSLHQRSLNHNHSPSITTHTTSTNNVKPTIAALPPNTPTYQILLTTAATPSPKETTAAQPPHTTVIQGQEYLVVQPSSQTGLATASLHHPAAHHQQVQLTTAEMTVQTTQAHAVPTAESVTVSTATATQQQQLTTLAMPNGLAMCVPVGNGNYQMVLPYEQANCGSVSVPQVVAISSPNVNDSVQFTETVNGVLSSNPSASYQQVLVSTAPSGGVNATTASGVSVEECGISTVVSPNHPGAAPLATSGLLTPAGTAEVTWSNPSPSMVTSSTQLIDNHPTAGTVHPSSNNNHGPADHPVSHSLHASASAHTTSQNILDGLEVVDLNGLESIALLPTQGAAPQIQVKVEEMKPTSDETPRQIITFIDEKCCIQKPQQIYTNIQFKSNDENGGIQTSFPDTKSITLPILQTQPGFSSVPVLATETFRTAVQKPLSSEPTNTTVLEHHAAVTPDLSEFNLFKDPSPVKTTSSAGTVYVDTKPQMSSVDDAMDLLETAESLISNLNSQPNPSSSGMLIECVTSEEGVAVQL